MEFDIINNESVHENIFKIEKNKHFSHSSEKNILFKTGMEVHETALCRHTHIYISQVGLTIFRLLVTTQHTIYHLYLLGDNNSVYRSHCGDRAYDCQ